MNLQTQILNQYGAILTEIKEFLAAETNAAEQKMHDVWQRPLQDKIDAGWTQRFLRLEKMDDPRTIWAYLDSGESRYREGDLLLLHWGNPFKSMLGRQFMLHTEAEDRWLLRRHSHIELSEDALTLPCYADPDFMDLTPFYDKAMAEICISEIGHSIILPLLAGKLEPQFDDRDLQDAEKIALAKGLNALQARAVGMAVGAEHLACIQGPPGTGKTKVLALIAQLLVSRGERVLLTSHTHTAINNALSRVVALGVPAAKVGDSLQKKALDESVIRIENLRDWEECPTNGYVVGATPFATTSKRLESYVFDTVIFDESSQITIPLALMAMRTGRKFIFIGDQKQLPPVALSKSVLDKSCVSIFARLIANNVDTVMLNETYRMNQWLTEWPSNTYYGSKLISSGTNCTRKLNLTATVDEPFAQIFNPTFSAVFIANKDTKTRTRNRVEASLIVDICEAATRNGLKFTEIGIVAPFRAQGKAIRAELMRRLGKTAARNIIADTVERMQGQEREMIIISMTTADPVFLMSIASFLFQPERLNVAITRAMTKLVVIGPDAAHLPDSDEPEIARWINQYRQFIAQLQPIDL